jgi:hypothetical protein
MSNRSELVKHYYSAFTFLKANLISSSILYSQDILINYNGTVHTLITIWQH